MGLEKKICILDYGSGNVKSVYNISSSINQNVIVSNDPHHIKTATHIILPGVGAFPASMRKIKQTIPLDVLEDVVLCEKKPFLGICVGMQVLAQKGYEFQETDGLGWIDGVVEKLQVGDLLLPHIGWNNVETTTQSSLFNNIGNNNDFYFVHSYAFKTMNDHDVIAKTMYGELFNSVIARDNIVGVQFHPEKSQSAGKILLSNFFDMS